MVEDECCHLGDCNWTTWNCHSLYSWTLVCSLNNVHLNLLWRLFNFIFSWNTFSALFKRQLELIVLMLHLVQKTWYYLVFLAWQIKEMILEMVGKFRFTYPVLWCVLTTLWIRFLTDLAIEDITINTYRMW
jgi:hypothetical protein